MQLAQCLKCGKAGVDNIDTRHDPHTGWIKRRKRCKACGHRWTSWEVPADALDALRAVVRGVLVPYEAEPVVGAQPLWVCAGCNRMEIRAATQPMERCKICRSIKKWKIGRSHQSAGATFEPSKWLIGESGVPAPLPDSPEWSAHVARICHMLDCDGLCGNAGEEHRDLCLRVAMLGRLPTSEER